MTLCRETACDDSCAREPDQPVGSGRRAARWVALIAALGCGVGFIVLVACIPGHGRDRRGAWSLQRVSRWILRAVGVRILVEGRPRSGPSLVVGNHVSWLDILALAASAPMQMVAKAEVGAWPLVGVAARRTGTLFLQREHLRDLPEAVAAITAALRGGSRVQVFPEATTRCGGALDPFRRAAFQAALDAGVVISPVTLRYLDAADAPTTVPAFVGAETLVRSVRRVLSARDCTVKVQWLPPIPAIAGTGRDQVDRAVVARLAQNAVAGNLGIPVLETPVGVRSAVGPPLAPTTAGTSC
jgi:1-acyl-sn-glycerol-3-phosphate acyltransferase